MMDQSKVKEDWERRGFSCDIWTDQPGQIWENYVHDVDELVMLLEGEIEITFQGRTFRPKVGEEILIPAGESHTVRNIGSELNRWFYGYKEEA
ncbi:MAG: cupin domain-containing protein [Candidatus Scalinduaceae bacterium]